VEGCLSQSSSGSGYILTDSSGVAYNLQGDSSELSSHVGQEVKISGELAANTASKDSSASSASSGSMGADASSNSITVKKVKKIAATCPAAAPSK
jgi:hypothetical protein